MSPQRYLDFDLELFEHARLDGRETARTRAIDYQRPAEAERVEFRPGLRDRVARLERRELDLAGLIELGEDLAAVLLPMRAREHFQVQLAGLAEDEGLRLRIRLGAWALAELPWEYAYVPARAVPRDQKDASGFLALDRRLSLVRHETLGRPLASLEPAPGETIRLVGLLADPVATGTLDLEREAEAIHSALADQTRVEHAIYRDAGRAQIAEAVNAGAHVLHFAGHGRFAAEMGEEYGTIEGKGFLLFEGGGGQVEEVSAEELALRLAASGIRLVVLAACEGGRRDGVRAWSGIAPALARSGVPAVVAMQYRVRDEKAIAFSTRFYRSLAAGRPVDAAVTDARVEMFDSKDAYGRDWGVPVLYLRTEETVVFPVPDRLALLRIGGRRAVNLGLTLLLATLVVVYFVFHLEPLWVREGLIGVAALAALSVYSALIAKLAGAEVEQALRRLVRHRKTARWLAVGCGLLAVALLATTSVFVEPDGPVIAESAVTVSSAALGYEAAFERGAERTRGRLFLSRFPPRQVAWTVEEPVGFELDGASTQTLWPGRTLRVPLTRLQEVVITVAWVLPGAGLVGLLPAADLESPERPFSVAVSLDGQPLADAGGAECPLADFRASGLFLGTGRPEVDKALGEARDDGTLDAFLERERDRLVAAGVPEEHARGMLLRWRGDLDRPCVVTDARLAPDTELRVDVFDHTGRCVGSGAAALSALTGRIKNFVVDKNDDC